MVWIEIKVIHRKVIDFCDSFFLFVNWHFNILVSRS